MCISLVRKAVRRKRNNILSDHFSNEGEVKAMAQQESVRQAGGGKLWVPAADPGVSDHGTAG